MTIKDIAKEAGCAIGTVSRVLNNHPNVSPVTKEKVMSVVEKHGFVLNKNAQQLKEQESKTIVIIVKGTSNPLLNSMLELIQEKILKRNYNSHVAMIDEFDNEAYKASQIYYERKPVGIIFLGGNPEVYKDDFSKIKIPCVLMTNQAEGVQNSNLSSVSTDDFLASKISAKHLIENGHKKIGVIGGNLEVSEISQRRFAGFMSALDENEINFEFEKAYVNTKYSLIGGEKAAEELLEKYPDLTAIFTVSDVMAIGACRYLHDIGKKIPDDISIIGFDALEITRFYYPRITTIQQLPKKIVEIGLDSLINGIENGTEATHELVPFKLIEGESIKCIK